MPRRLKARSRPTDTTLQRHVSFFDDDGDRGVGVAECAHGLRALGMPIGLAEAVARIKSFYDGTLFYKLAREQA